MSKFTKALIELFGENYEAEIKKKTNQVKQIKDDSLDSIQQDDVPLTSKEKLDSQLDSLVVSYPYVIPRIFNLFKKYKRKFWSIEERQDINKMYHQDLERLNQFPVPYINIFRDQPYKIQEEIGNTFFYDIIKNPEYRAEVINKINHNVELAYAIVNMANGLNPFKEDSVVKYYNEVATYLEEQKPNIKYPSRYGDERPDVVDYNLEKNTDEGNRLITEATQENGKEILKETPEKIEYLTLWEHKYIFKDPTEHTLTKESISFLENLSDVTEKDITRDILDNLIENYKTCVPSGIQKQFLKTLKKNEVVFESSILIEWGISNDFIIKFIREYYSYDPERLQRYEKTGQWLKARAEDKENTINKFEEYLEKTTDVGYLFYFIDVLGYYYGKGYCFINGETYKELNAVMRCVVKSSPRAWYCFDPMVRGLWYPYYERGELTNDDCAILLKTLKYIIKQNINISSRLIVNAFEIANTCPEFKKAKLRITKSIKQYKAALNAREPVF